MLPVVPEIMRDRSDELTTLLDLLPTSLRTAGTGAGTIGRAAILEVAASSIDQSPVWSWNIATNYRCK